MVIPGSLSGGSVEQLWVSNISRLLMKRMFMQ
jgi:hypothetical protein